MFLEREKLLNPIFAGDLQLTNAAELRLILKLTFGGIQNAVELRFFKYPERCKMYETFSYCIYTFLNNTQYVRRRRVKCRKIKKHTHSLPKHVATQGKERDKYTSIVVESRR